MVTMPAGRAGAGLWIFNADDLASARSKGPRSCRRSAVHHSAVAPPNWLDEAYRSIEAAKKNNGGLMGMLESARSGHSIKAFLKRSATNANNIALITQNGIDNAGALISQMAQQNIERQNAEAM